MGAMTTNWRDAVRPALRDEAWLDRLLGLCRETITTTPGWAPEQYDDETLRQTIRAFIALLVEALDAPGAAEPQAGNAWRLFMDATIPAYVAAGQSAGSIVRGAATFLVLVAAEITSVVPPTGRDDALRWVAAFAGRYVSDVCAAATAGAA
jgi:hypothetical protein